MKIIKKIIKECDLCEWWTTKVCDITYTHKWETWKILIRDFIEEDEDNVMKQLHKYVKESYKEYKQ